MMSSHQPPPLHVLKSAAEVAQQSEQWLADQIRIAVEDRGACSMAVSGGHSPWPMLESLARRSDLPWGSVSIFQVDERIAPEGDEDRNLTQLNKHVLDVRPSLRAKTYPMPVNDPDIDQAADRYASRLMECCGSPIQIDIIHLGLGPDGHTASLVPGDPVLKVRDRDVALTGGLYQGRRRMTLTYPAINRARRIMWQVVGGDKKDALGRMMAGDDSIPGGLVSSSQAVIFADQSAVTA
ncbi:MAG: 6-phosphogluconolactonase [Phycisphaerae bacterium]|nr:6-phosphogluconolactonase [Phycisphaerae bacterium]